MPDAQEALERISWQLDVVKSLEQQFEAKGHWSLATPGSDLEVDDAAMGSYQTSHLVANCLGMGLDGLRTARLIFLADDGLRFPIISHYAVLRAVLESSALKAKMRRDHSVQMRRQRNQLRQLGARAGIEESTFSKGLPGFGPIIRDAAEDTGIKGSQAYGVWCGISGLTHPSVSRATALSDIEIMSTEGDIHEARITTRYSMVTSALDAGMMTHFHALELAALRGGRDDITWKPTSEELLPPRFRR